MADIPWSGVRHCPASPLSPVSPAHEKTRDIPAGCLAASREDQAGVILLAAEALSRSSEERNRLAPQVVANWLNPRGLGEATDRARKLKKNDPPFYVDMDTNLPMWMFLHAAKYGFNPMPTITVDLVEAKRRITAAFPMGFAEDTDLELTDELRTTRFP